MADQKISELPAAAALDGSEQIPVVQGGVTKRTTITEVDATVPAHPDLAAHDALGLATQSELDTAFALTAPLASPTFTGITTAPEFSASGLTGAVAASRYVGGTASGAPTTGTFVVGDFVIDRTGKIWINTVAGSPGTWVVSGFGAYQAAFGIVRPPHAQFSTANITVGNANSCRFYRVVEGGTISKVRLSIGVSSGNICVAAYTNSGVGQAAAPTGGRLATSGSVASPGTGIQDVSLGASVVVAPGDWIAVGADNATVTFIGITGAGDSTISAGIAGVESVFPASATPTVIPGNNRMICFVGVA